MAKVRVYELAKDLNMTNKQLLDKMKELNIEVKSHMSSLEDSAISTIKDSLFGSKKKQTDVKVRPSVIRRRKARNVSESDLSEEDIADEEEIETPQMAEQSQAVDQEVSEVEEPETSEPEIVQETATNKMPESQVKKVLRKKSEPAKIIKPVQIPEEKKVVVPEPEETVEPETQVVAEPIVDESAAVEEEPVVENAPEAEKIGADTEPDALDREESITEADSDEETSVDDDAEDDSQAKKKKVKKKKGSTPAKIVKKADPTVLENIRRMKAEEKANGHQAAPSRPSSGGPGASPQDMPIPGMMIPDPSDGRKRGWSKDDGASDGPGKRKRRKKKSVVEGDDLYQGRGRKKRGKKDAKGKKGNFQKTQITTPKAIKRRIKIDEAIELAELAKRMGIKANEMIVKLMGMGVMATVNQTIDFDTASLVAAEFNFEVEKANFEEETLLNVVEEEVEAEENLQACPPVVTIMGHVDHGKTSLLDVIRESKITSGEAGGITQHIGAYNVETPNGGRITFLDTPGHAAFTAMRSRGAKVTDIVILVVAADDGVMPQTIEAINHAKAADVPVVVAVNKMDKAGADPDRVMRELSEHGLLAEDWGGSAIFVKVSAKTGEGIDDLLEMVLLQAEVLELRANPDRNATGYVVESRLDTGRGAVATVLVKQGTLKDGDPIVCGLHSGRIRAMIDDTGERIESAGPATPVEIVGLTGVPDAGDEFIAVASDKDAKQIANHRMQKQRAKELAKKSRANLEKMFENLGSAEVKELKLIVKADVQGSIEALNDSLKDLAKEEVDVKIVHSGAGTINESDVALAGVSDAIIIGFNVRPTPQIRKMAKDEHVDMRFYDIIYDVINDIKAALDGMMPSTFEEIIIGRAEVRDTFVVPKIGTIAGCAIVEGRVVRGKKVRLLRDGVIKCDTELSSLRRFKDDVKEVDQGYECGIGLEKYNDIKVGDAIECYEVEERKYQG